MLEFFDAFSLKEKIQTGSKIVVVNSSLAMRAQEHPGNFLGSPSQRFSLLE
jgi:hypothetical protein